MANFRQYMERSALILNGWLETGHSAYVLLFETRGNPDQWLDEVMATTQHALSEVLGGEWWQDKKKKHVIAGQISTLRISKAVSDKWVVRRWVVLGSAKELNTHEAVALTESIRKRWDLALSKSQVQLVSPALHLRPIALIEARAVAQLITGCQSALDPLIEPFASSLALQYSSDEAEDSAADLAARYRADGKQLGEEFMKAGRWDRLTLRKGSFSFRSVKQNRPHFSQIEVPDTSLDFMEYALATFAKPVYSAMPVRAEGLAHPVWNALVESSQKIGPNYIEIELSEKGRSRKV